MDLESKFASGTNTSTSKKKIQEQTIGLVSASEFRTLQQKAEEAEEEVEDEDALQTKKLAEKKARKERKKAQKRRMATLSFVDDEEEELILPKKIVRKDPTLDTSFLPDVHRDAELQAQRQRLEQEYLERQEELKQSNLEVVYSYWDGSGHRQSCQVPQGHTIGQFLAHVKEELVKGGHFPELKSLTADDLLYVKEDVIIPHDLSFHDLITMRARGQSGPLFEFGVRDDVRVGPLDSRIATDSSHPGKVLERRWYERNKHIFPASRWQVFDPNKSYGRYTVGDKESRQRKK